MDTQEVSLVNVDYVQHYGDDLIVANAARVSFDKYSNYIGAADAFEAGLRIASKNKQDSTDLKYINYTDAIPEDLVNEGKYLGRGDFGLIYYLAESGHTSCFEHMGATLKLKVPIFIARQIQRHRAFSYNEISRRYVDNEPEFFWPDKWRKRAKDKKQGSSEEVVDVMQGLATDSYFPVQQVMEEQLKAAVNTYSDALVAGVAPELARMILPQNMYTEFYMSGSLRNFSHFLKLRLHEHAQVEAQQVAQMILEILKPLFPVSMKALLEN